MKNEMLKALGRCRVMNKSMAEMELGVTTEEIESLIEQKLVAIEVNQDNLESNEHYTLTEKGEKTLREEVPLFGEIYRGFIYAHDLCLMDFYLRRTKEEREKWLTRDDMTKKHMIPGTIDGAYVNSNGELEGVEVLSKKAKPSAVEKAESFIKNAGIIQMNYLVY